MPLLPAWRIVLREMTTPRASTEKIAAPRARDGRAGDFALDAFEHEAVAARVENFAIADRDVAARCELDEAASSGSFCPCRRT